MLEALIEELGTQATLRQAVALTVVALANKAGIPAGVAMLDRELGVSSPGTTSKVIKAMVHVETPRKGSLSNTLVAERDPDDFRKWGLTVTPKGVEALTSVIAGMQGKRPL
jgi:DNA-binding MarR family transcriptional regulator